MKCVGHKNVPHDYIECLTDLEPLMMLNAEGEASGKWLEWAAKAIYNSCLQQHTGTGMVITDIHIQLYN